MDHRAQIQVDLIKLVGNERLLRLTYPDAGLVLEKKVDPQQALLSQKEKLFAIFEAALSKAEPNPA
jgi:hypothetical protein